MDNGSEVNDGRKQIIQDLLIPNSRRCCTSWNMVKMAVFRRTSKKTGKRRTLRLNPQLQQHIQECHGHIQPLKDTSYILVSQKGTVFTIQRINVILKEIKKKYRLKVKNFSCHSLRKTFGRQVYNMNSENSELALVKLMELFNHSSIAITKRYLGLRQEEILETYDFLIVEHYIIEQKH